MRGAVGHSGSERAQRLLGGAGTAGRAGTGGGAGTAVVDREASFSQGRGEQERRWGGEAGLVGWEDEEEVGFLSGEEDEAWMGSGDSADAELLNLVSVFVDVFLLLVVFFCGACMRVCV